MNTYTEAVILGMIAGFLARLYMLRTDYRNYPSYPHGYIIHLSLGAIAASLASIALPALLEEEYTADYIFGVMCPAVSGYPEYGAGNSDEVGRKHAGTAGIGLY